MRVRGKTVSSCLSQAGPTIRPVTVPLYGLDLETDTTTDGLDPAVAAIVAVAVSTDAEDHVFTGSESSILDHLDRLVADLAPGIIVTWNGATFDLPFLACRSRVADRRIGLRVWEDHAIACHRTGEPGEVPVRGAWFGHRHLDGYRLYRADVGRSLGLSCGLKALSRLVGLAPVEVDRSRIQDLDHETLVAYVASDAHLARRLVQRRLPAALAFADPPSPVAERSTPVHCHTAGAG